MTREAKLRLPSETSRSQSPLAAVLGAKPVCFARTVGLRWSEIPFQTRIKRLLQVLSFRGKLELQIVVCKHTLRMYNEVQQADTVSVMRKE